MMDKEEMIKIEQLVDNFLNLVGRNEVRDALIGLLSECIGFRISDYSYNFEEAFNEFKSYFDIKPKVKEWIQKLYCPNCKQEFMKWMNEKDTMYRHYCTNSNCFYLIIITLDWEKKEITLQI